MTRFPLKDLGLVVSTTKNVGRLKACTSLVKVRERITLALLSRMSRML